MNRERYNIHCECFKIASHTEVGPISSWLSTKNGADFRCAFPPNCRAFEDMIEMGSYYPLVVLHNSQGVGRVFAEPEQIDQSYLSMASPHL